ncbi:hypothetical protein HYR65_03545 [Candidatus Azambacteria bacterium]|nr:hypothetical protein [Candidatus Azambacteria bacterium]
MQTQGSKIGPAIIITAVVVGGAVYYFTGTKNPESASPKKENSSFTQSSKEYAVMGREVLSALECSAWASKVNDAKESERLFMFGYAQGQKFLGALRAEKIKQEDVSQEVPIGITMLLQGPSDEFILGRIFENAQEEALNKVFYTNYDHNNLNPEDYKNLLREINSVMVIVS